MTKFEIIDFINKNLAAHLATVDNGKPRVRGMLICRADTEGIIFHTGTSKDLYKQLMKNPDVELYEIGAILQSATLDCRVFQYRMALKDSLKSVYQICNR